MAYESAGLYVLANTGRRQMWMMEATDAVGSITATGYITDAGPASSGRGAPGKGMRPGDIVIFQRVGTAAPALNQTITDSGMYYVSAVDAATGAGTIVAMGAT